MNKILFFNEKEKMILQNEINKKLETKNRLLKLIISNPDKKTPIKVRQAKLNKFEDQIFLLESMRSHLNTITSREEINELNNMIAYYHSIDSN